MKARPVPILSLFGGALFLLCVWGYLEIAEDYPEGKYREFDEFVLRSLRTPENPGVPRGPLWLLEVVRDISALGGGAVLTLVTLGTSGYLLLTRRWRDSLSIWLASLGGEVLNIGLKALAGRPRPDIVPRLAEATSSSFPSGHSMLSAIVYLSVGALLAQNARDAKSAFYVISFALLLTLMVGCTRVYLGVHYPSDVIAGWIAGAAWALLCLAILALLNRRRDEANRRGTYPRFAA